MVNPTAALVERVVCLKEFVGAYLSTDYIPFANQAHILSEGLAEVKTMLENFITASDGKFQDLLQQLLHLRIWLEIRCRK